MTAVCLSANTLYYPKGGGHRWVYLNWALGLRAAGCDVVWLETVDRETSPGEARALAEVLRAQLAPYGLDGRVALCRADGTAIHGRWLDLAAAAEADVLIDLRYDLATSVLGHYLASGKPVVVEHTGPSALLPDAEGMFRVHDVNEAAAALRAAVADYDRHAKAARALAEAHFDARAVAGAVVERALA